MIDPMFPSSSALDTAHIAHKMGKMKNITLRMDERTIKGARLVAAERGTSVNAMIREYLDDLVKVRSRQAVAREEILRMCGESGAELGERKWRREELYES